MEGTFNRQPELVLRELREKGLREKIPPTVRDELARFEVKGESIGFACSGGADSVFAVLLVLAMFPQLHAHAYLVHAHHAMRGSEADADSEYVSALAAWLGVSCHTGTHTGPGLKNEVEARDFRRVVYEQALERHDGSVLVTAHHADDLVETFILRMLQGVGLEGLTALRAIQKDRGRVTLRPLLGFRKKEIIALLDELTVSWREDHTNQLPDYERNRIRQLVLPVLEEVSHRDVGNMVTSSHLQLSEDLAALEWMVEKLSPDLETQPDFPVPAYCEAPLALVRRAVSRWLNGQGVGTLNNALLAAIVALVKGEKSGVVTISSGLFVKRREDRLVLARVEPEAPHKAFYAAVDVSVKGSETLPGGVFFWERVSLAEGLRERILSGKVDSREECFLLAPPDSKLVIRNREAGDRFQLLGMKGTSKLKSILIDRKIAQKERELLPVVCFTDGKIVWVPGLPPARPFCLDEKSTEALRLTYHRF